MAGHDFRIDWNNNGSFEDPGEDMTSRLLAESPFTIAYGRDQARSIASARAGSLSGIKVNNLSRDYSPENATSPLASNLKPGRPMWISYNTRANLVPNPSFEVGVSGWSSSRATVIQDVGQFQVGTKSMRATITNVSGTPTVNSQRFAVRARRTYTVSAYDRLGVSGSRSAGVKMIFYDSAGGILLNPSTVFTSSSAGVWTRRSATHVAPEGATQADVIIGYSPATLSDIHHIDGVMVEESAALGTYFDGSTGGGAFWRTTAHESASIIGYVLYRGYIDNFELNPEAPAPSAALSGLDALARFSQANLSSQLFQGIRTGQAVHEVLDAVGWPAGKRDIDTGATSIAWWWEEGNDALSALQRIVNSEGPTAFVSIGTDGELIFRDRHHRLLRTASTSVQATYRDSGGEPLFTKPFDYDAGFREVVNSCSFTVTERLLRSTSVVWESEDLISVQAGVPMVIIAAADDPFIEALTPNTAANPIELLSGSVSVSLSRTSGQSTTITLNSAGGCVINGIRLRARPVTVTRTLKIDVDDAVSIAEHGPRRYDGDAPWMGQFDALAVGQLILSQRAQRAPTVTIRLAASPTLHPVRFAAGMARNLSDRVHIVEAETGINLDFFVEQIGHVASIAGRLHEVALGCEKAQVSPLDSSSTVFVLNSATLGVLNTNRLGH